MAVAQVDGAARGMTAEEAELQLLGENMASLDTLTREANDILMSCDERMQRLQRALQPVHNKTQMLRTYAKNLDAVVAYGSRSKKLLDSASQEERVIKSGPSGNLEAYVGSLDRSAASLRRLKSPPASGKERTGHNDKMAVQLTQILQSGAKELLEYARELLRREIGAYNVSKLAASGDSMPRLPPPSLRALRTIIRAFNSILVPVGYKNTVPDEVIALRGEYLVTSLQSLSQNARGTINKRNSMPRNSMASTRDVSAFSTYCRAFVEMVESEAELLKLLLGSDAGTSATAQVCHAAAVQFQQTASELRDFSSKHSTTDSALLYHMIMDLKRACRIGPLLQQPGQSDDMVFDLWKSSRIMGENTFKEIFAGVQTQVSQITSIGGQCKPEPICSTTMSRLAAVADDADAARPILAAAGDRSWGRGVLPSSSSSEKTVDSGESESSEATIFTRFLSDVVQTLIQGLDDKANTLLKTRKMQRSVYMLNNFEIIRSAIDKSALYETLGGEERRSIDTQTRRFTDLFLAPWGELVQMLMSDKQRVGASLSKDERNRVKRLFQDVQEKLNEMFAAARQLSVPSADLRMRLITDAKQLVMPAYRMVRERHLRSGFSKTPEKHIHYMKDSTLEQQFLQILNG